MCVCARARACVCSRIMLFSVLINLVFSYNYNLFKDFFMHYICLIMNYHVFDFYLSYVLH